MMGALLRCQRRPKKSANQDEEGGGGVCASIKRIFGWTFVRRTQCKQRARVVSGREPLLII